MNLMNPYILSFYAIAESVGIFLEAEQIHRSSYLRKVFVSRKAKQKLSKEAT
jgi:hypothetical protein